ncbi:MAG: DUF2059 domain-containing protein [Deltaproteobacteria bacterium]|nr:DUF2059 domain-containing protein [Deltaproteobacteria bacterium]
MKKTFVLMICLFLAVLVFNKEGLADEPISAETFKRYTKVAGLENQYNQAISLFATNFQKGMIAGFKNAIDGKNIPEDVKARLHTMVKESSDNFVNIFENTFKKEIKFEELVLNVYLPAYNKYFSESELIEIIKFYNSPLGKKVSKFTPMLMQESSSLFLQLYGAKVQLFGGELMNNEIQNLLVKVKELKK